MNDIEAQARALWLKDNSTLSVLSDLTIGKFWAAEDEITRLHYRRQSQQKLTAAKP